MPRGTPCPVLERGVSGVRFGTRAHFGRGAVEESSANCAYVVPWETSPKASCLLPPEALSSGRRRPWTPCLLPLPSFRDPLGGRRSGRGREEEGRALEAAHRRQPVPGGVCPWPGGHVPTSPSPPQYFSTLENSIVSLFVLLTTAK